MYRIALLFLNRDFEHDVYELVKAFYPEAEIHTLYHQNGEEYDFCLRTERREGQYILYFQNDCMI